MNFDLSISGVSVIVLVLGVVEAAKRLGIEGKWSFVLALFVGSILTGVAKAVELALIPASFVPYVELVVFGIGGGLAATGVFDLIKKVSAR